MNETLYNAAQQGAVWRDMTHFGRFLCSGSDAATLLHHLTTNDIKGLRPGMGCDAVLITAKARVLDWLTILRQESGLWVLTSPNRRAMFAPHAQKFVLFRQDVRIEDVSDSSALFGLFGPQARDVLQLWGAVDVLDRPLNEPQNFEVNGVALRMARTRRLPGEGVLIAADDREGLRRLVQESGLSLVDNETFNILRVEGGLPAAGLELTEDINPWEAGFGAAISLHKGCYNGQEVVARLNTYQKIKQRLCGLRLQKVIPMGERALLKSASRDAGFLTSSVQSPRFGPIALAFVRSDYQTPGQQLEVLAEAGPQTATVTTLPFES